MDAFGGAELVRAPCLPHAADARYGAGRFLSLPAPLRLADAVERLKQHLGLPRLRVASPADAPPIRRVAVCAGAGGSVFEKLSGFDLFVTGEMRHHDVRARVQTGSSVVLAEHTHTERGYLRHFAERLAQETSGQVTFHVSSCDREPLSWV